MAALIVVLFQHFTSFQSAVPSDRPNLPPMVAVSNCVWRVGDHYESFCWEDPAQVAERVADRSVR